MKIGFLFFVTIFSFYYSIAQTEQIDFENITTSMGLVHGDVTCFCQDHEGYMWIGTADGLNKYDGVEFQVFKKNLNDSASLSNSYINCIYEDKQNNLWIGIFDGLYKFNREKNTIEKVPFIDIHGNKFENSVKQIFEDNSNHLWIGCNQGVYLLNRENKRFSSCFEDSTGLTTLTDAQDICQDKSGSLWFAFQHSKNLGIIKYNPETKMIIRYSTQNQKYKLKENSISSILIDNLNNIWIGYYSMGIEVLNVQINTSTIYDFNTNSIGDNHITSIVQQEDGKIFIGTIGGGISVFDPVSKSFHLYSRSESAKSLLSNSISKLYLSNEGSVWIGCWGGGVSVYDKRYGMFKHYKEDKNSLTGSSVTCFTEDQKGNIWIASDGGGINMLNPLTGKFTNYKSDIKNPHTLTNNKVLAIETDGKDGLWAGMWQGGLNYFKIENEKLILKKKYNLVDENDSASNCVIKIYSKDNQLWVGNFSTGAYKFNPSTEKFNRIKPTVSQYGYNSVKDIFCDLNNELWIASDKVGLLKINQKSGESEIFTPNEKDNTKLINNALNVVFEDNKKRLWFGGDQCGLNLFNPKTKSFSHYTTDQGLPDNTIVGILEDNHNNLWISTTNGISKASIDSINGKIKISFRNYAVQDGLQSKVFNRWAYFKSKNGMMYFGGLNGFNTFYPNNVKDNSFLPPVFITDFLLFNKQVIIGAQNSPLEKHISQTKKIVLSYSQSIFTFRFIALSYIFSEKNQYAYKMEGLEKDWNYIGNRREATYTNLDPGEYTFRVKASNNDGVWNEKGVSLKVIILPPWWKTLWFRLITLLIIVLAIYTGYLLKLKLYRDKQKELSILVEKRTHEVTLANKQLLQKQTLIKSQTDKIQEANTQLTKLNTTKDRILSIIGHDLRNPFNVVSGFSEILLEEYRDLPPETIEQYLNLISNSSKNGNVLLENLLQWSRTQTGGIIFEPIHLNLLLVAEESYNFLEGDAIKKNISIQLQIDPDISVEVDENMLKTILRNLLSNAIKFTPENGIITISSTLITDQVEVCVSDSGVGIPEEKIPLLFNIDTNISTRGTSYETGTGLGLILCKEFVEKHHGKIWVESKEGVGSQFKFTLPLA